MDTQRLPTLDIARRKAEAIEQWAAAKVAEFNARPARRITDIRVQGWTVIYPEAV